MEIRSPVNIALVKYWGKLESNLNIPLNSSFSLTLSRNQLFTHTKVSFADEDSFILFDNEKNIIETDFPKGFKLVKNFFTSFKKSNFNV